MKEADRLLSFLALCKTFMYAFKQLNLDDFAQGFNPYQKPKISQHQITSEIKKKIIKDHNFQSRLN